VMSEGGALACHMRHYHLGREGGLGEGKNAEERQERTHVMRGLQRGSAVRYGIRIPGGGGLLCLGGEREEKGRCR
jgi:hypothetical protein